MSGQETQAEGAEPVVPSPTTELHAHLVSDLVLARSLQASLGRSDAGRHVALAVTKLEEALLWLNAGRVLH